MSSFVACQQAFSWRGLLCRTASLFSDLPDAHNTFESRWLTVVSTAVLLVLLCSFALRVAKILIDSCRTGTTPDRALRIDTTRSGSDVAAAAAATSGPNTPATPAAERPSPQLPASAPPSPEELIAPLTPTQFSAVRSTGAPRTHHGVRYRFQGTQRHAVDPSLRRYLDEPP